MGNRDPRSWNWQTGTRWYSSFSCPATDGRWLAGDEAILVVIHPDVSPGKPQPGRMEAQRGNCAEFIRVTRPCTRCTVRAPLKPHNVNSNANPSKTTIWRRQTVELRTVWNRSQQNRTDHHPISSYIILHCWLSIVEKEQGGSVTSSFSPFTATASGKSWRNQMTLMQCRHQRNIKNYLVLWTLLFSHIRISLVEGWFVGDGMFFLQNTGRMSFVAPGFCRMKQRVIIVAIAEDGRRFVNLDRSRTRIW